MDRGLNTFEVMQVTADLEQRGVRDYDLRSGNDCVWACTRPRAGIWQDFYYIFRDGRIIEVVIE